MTSQPLEDQPHDLVVSLVCLGLKTLTEEFLLCDPLTADKVDLHVNHISPLATIFFTLSAMACCVYWSFSVHLGVIA